MTCALFSCPTRFGLWDWAYRYALHHFRFSLNAAIPLRWPGRPLPTNPVEKSWSPYSGGRREARGDMP